MDRGEVDALELRAAANGVKPTVLARNTGDVADKLDQVVAAVEEWRAVVGY